MARLTKEEVLIFAVASGLENPRVVYRKPLGASIQLVIYHGAAGDRQEIVLDGSADAKAIKARLET